MLKIVLAHQPADLLVVDDQALLTQSSSDATPPVVFELLADGGYRPIEGEQGGEAPSGLPLDGGSQQSPSSVEACADRLRFYIEVAGRLLHIQSLHVTEHEDRSKQGREFVDRLLDQDANFLAGHFRLRIGNGAHGEENDLSTGLRLLLLDVFDPDTRPLGSNPAKGLIQSNTRQRGGKVASARKLSRLVNALM